MCDNVIRRCLSGLGNTVVMVFAALFGITIRGILMHAGVSRFSACVNSEWLQAVRVVICELRRGFLGSDFYVDCLLGLRGDQTAAAYIFEQCIRATLRQHLFLVDLRDQETLPRVEPFWSEGWDLGIRNYWQYIQPSSASQMGQDGGGVPIARAKRTLTVLRIIRYATVDLVERHGASVLVSGPVKSLSFLCRSFMLRQQLIAESCVGRQLATLPHVGCLERSLLEFCLGYYEKMRWADFQRTGVGGRARESEHSLDAQLCVPEGVDCVSQWFDRWCRFLRAERSTPQSRALPAYDVLRTIAAVGCDAGDDGDYDFARW